MDTLARLEQIIRERRGASPDESYVAKLNSRGLPVVARKVGEEAVEAAIAAISYEKDELVGEAVVCTRPRGIVDVAMCVGADTSRQLAGALRPPHELR